MGAGRRSVCAREAGAEPPRRRAPAPGTAVPCSDRFPSARFSSRSQRGAVQQSSFSGAPPVTQLPQRPALFQGRPEEEDQGVRRLFHVPGPEQSCQQLPRPQSPSPPRGRPPAGRELQGPFCPQGTRGDVGEQTSLSHGWMTATGVSWVEARDRPTVLSTEPPRSGPFRGGGRCTRRPHARGPMCACGECVCTSSGAVVGDVPRWTPR